jgi:hypothetical protein
MRNGEHPQALTLSLLIHAEGLRVAGADFEEGIHTVIDKYLTERDFHDERKADLYALLAEKLKPNMLHSQMREVCDACLKLNATHWSFNHGR